MKLYRVVAKNLGPKADIRPILGESGRFHNEFARWNPTLDIPRMPKRICCAPSIAQCIISMPDTVFNVAKRRVLRVYVTETDDYIDCPPDVEWDTDLTDEKWLLKKKRFYLDGTLGREVQICARSVLYADNSGTLDQVLTSAQQMILLRYKLKAIQFLLDQHYQSRLAKAI